jgi:hypothetical protein
VHIYLTIGARDNQHAPVERDMHAGSEVRDRVLSDSPSAASDTSHSVNHLLIAPIPRGISEPEVTAFHTKMLD